MEVTVSLKKKQPRKEWSVAFLAFHAVVDIAPGCSVVFLKKCVFLRSSPYQAAGFTWNFTQLWSYPHTSLILFGEASVNNELETVCSPFTPYIFSTMQTQADLYC